MTILFDPIDEYETQAHESSYADLTERLFSQFETSLSLTVIVDVIRDARNQLRGSPTHALPELTERLAYQRLTALAGSSDSSAVR